MHGNNQEYQPGERRNPDNELYRQLRSLRIRHFRINLHERTIRLRQNSLIIAGLLSTVLIPLLMLAFMPANIFLRNTEFPGSLQMAALIQLLSWSIVLLQATALAHGPTERYLDTWPLNRDLRKKLDINILLLANHLLWLVTVPVLIWYLAVTANWSGNWPENWAGALLAGFKFVILLYFILVLQLRYLERQSMPWLGLFVANSVFSAGLFLIDRLPTPALYVSLLLTSFLMD
jgi:hypothetical protein